MAPAKEFAPTGHQIICDHKLNTCQIPALLPRDDHYCVMLMQQMEPHLPN